MLRGEIWLIDMDPSHGAEISKTRPALIISDDSIGILPLRVIVPLTDWKERYAISLWMVKIMPTADNGLNKPSAADAFQVRSVSTQRFVQRLGRVSVSELNQIVNAVQIVIGAEL